MQYQDFLYRHSVRIVSDEEMRVIGGGMFPGETEGVIREMHKMRPGVPPENQSGARPEERRGF